MRRAVVLLLVVCFGAVAAAVVVADGRTTTRVFTIGVVPFDTVGRAEPGQVLCQGPIDVPKTAPFDGITIVARGEAPGRARVLATIEGPAGGVVLARGRAGIAPQPAPGTVAIPVAPRVRGGREIRVCLRSLGPGTLAVRGNADVAAASSTLRLDGRKLDRDMTLDFTAPQSSLLGRAGDVMRRAALFRPDWTGTWTFWLLAALVALGVPVLLAVGLRSAGLDEPAREPPR